MYIRSAIKRLIHDTEGTTAVEYAVMLALILVTMIVGITATGSGVSDWWNDINTELSSSGF